ncbi:MAG: D-alanyl-D-alanine carboxypeptidase [Oscillospiraceae bacterium]|nr:D-alanyl-D-alanine carboxypeptidase [Oscillospiraceae bacterium]
MKKLAFLLAILFWGAYVSGFVHAETDETPLPQSTAYVLIEATTGTVLAQSNSRERLPIASLTKIMLLLLTAEELNSGRLSLSEEVTATAHAASMEGSTIWLNAGEAMTVADLVKSVVIASANDAAVALAERVAGSEPSFVALMNRKAHVLGMNNTNFVNATGLDHADHVSTAQDIAIMSRALMREENYVYFAEYALTRLCSVRTGTERETQLLNTNKLITYYNGIEGLKTGTTDNAGHCLAAAAVRGDMRLISVVLGCADESARLTLSEHLLDTGFGGFEMHVPDVSESEDTRHVVGLTLPVLRGTVQQVAVAEQNPPVIVIPRGQASRIEWQVYLPDEITAPIAANQPVGTITATLGGEVIYEGYVMAAESVDRVTFWLVLKRLTWRFFGG